MSGPMTTDDGASTTTASWFGAQSLGPALMILFGLVLIFTPLASVGAAGSVGNAGAQFPKCPPGSDCPTPTTAAPTTAAPTTAAPTTAAPTTAAPTVDGVPPIVDQPGLDGVPDVGPEADADVLGTTAGSEGADSASSTSDRTELALTGSSRASLPVTLLGLALVLGGGALLVTSRRGRSASC
jgi:hypothetical protein